MQQYRCSILGVGENSVLALALCKWMSWFIVRLEVLQQYVQICFSPETDKEHL